MNIQLNSSVKISIATFVVVFLSGSGCGKDDIKDVFGIDSAHECVSEKIVTNGIAFTNNCDKTIIVQTKDKKRLVIGPKQTHTLGNIKFRERYGVCFAPKEPKFTTDSKYICK